MKNHVILLTVIITAFASFLLGSCDSEDELDELSLVEYKLPPLCWWKEFSSNKVLIINDYRDFIKYVKFTESIPVVDFSKHTLILAGGETNVGISQVDHEVLKKGKNHLTMEVAVHLTITANIDHWVVAYLTSKAKNTKVDLNLTINER